MRSPLDPVDLGELAVCLRDSERLDAAVLGQGILEAVVIDGIIIRRELEEVIFSQGYEDHEGELRVRMIVVDSEDIRWIRPTQCEGLPLVTLDETMTGGEPMKLEDAVQVAIEAVIEHINVYAHEIKAGSNGQGWRQDVSTARKVSIVLAWSMTDATQHKVGECFNGSQATVSQILTTLRHSNQNSTLKPVVLDCRRTLLAALKRPTTFRWYE